MCGLSFRIAFPLIAASIITLAMSTSYLGWTHRRTERQLVQPIISMCAPKFSRVRFAPRLVHLLTRSLATLCGDRLGSIRDKDDLKAAPPRIKHAREHTDILSQPADPKPNDPF